MADSSFEGVELVVRTIAQTAVDNEKYFGELDAVVGDGDFGYSMARGFEIVLADCDAFDRDDIGTFLKKIAVVITSRVGGTSGPIWGTAFLRAGAVAADKTELTADDVDRDAPRGDRGHQEAREVRPGRQDPARRAPAGRRRAREGARRRGRPRGTRSGRRPPRLANGRRPPPR